jgi:hypothetical protein
MNAPFLQTLFPGIATVCGRVLPRLTLWRLACLQAIESPFLSVKGNDEVTLADLLLAIRAVSTPNLQPPDLRASFHDRWHWRRYHKSTVYLQAQARIFVDWLAVQQMQPELWQPAEDGIARALTAPANLARVAALMDAGMTHAEAWDTAPGYGTWLCLAAAERETDRVRFVTDDDEELSAEMDAEDLRSEAEIIAQAKRDLGEESFSKWLDNRLNNQRTN